MRWRRRSAGCWEGQTPNPLQYLISLLSQLRSDSVTLIYSVSLSSRSFRKLQGWGGRCCSLTSRLRHREGLRGVSAEFPVWRAVMIMSLFSSLLFSSLLFSSLLFSSPFLSFPFLSFLCFPLHFILVNSFPFPSSRAGWFQSEHKQRQEISPTGLSPGKSNSRLSEVRLEGEGAR